MKLYRVMSVVCSGVILSANPFSLEENLKNLNEDQNDLFVELKTVQEQKENSDNQKKDSLIVESQPQKTPSPKQNKTQTLSQEESEIKVTLTPISKEEPHKTDKQIPEIPNLSTTIKTPQNKHDIPEIPIITQKTQKIQEAKEKEALEAKMAQEKQKQEALAKAKKEAKEKEALEARMAQKKREQEEALLKQKALAKAKKEAKEKEALEAKMAQEKQKQEALAKAKKEAKEKESSQALQSTQKKETLSQIPPKLLLPIQKDMLDERESYVSEEEKIKKRLLEQEQKAKEDADKAYLKAIQAVDAE